MRLGWEWVIGLVVGLLCQWDVANDHHGHARSRCCAKCHRAASWVACTADGVVHAQGLHSLCAVGCAQNDLQVRVCQEVEIYRKAGG